MKLFPSLHWRYRRATPHGGVPASSGGFRFTGHEHAGRPEELDAALDEDDAEVAPPPVAEDVAVVATPPQAASATAAARSMLLMTRV
jgi:hypothetical protein